MPDPPHDDQELGFALPKPAVLTKTRALWLVIAAGAVIAGAFVVGYLPRKQSRRALDGTAAADSVVGKPRVQVVAPKSVASDRALSLAGTVTPLESTTIYPRTSGYVGRWLVDIGDKVAAGQLLAEIDAPDVDAQLLQAEAQEAQAEAALLQAKATWDKAKKDLDRNKPLLAQKLIADTDYDTFVATAAVDAADITVAEANIAAQQANVKHLAEQQSWERVLAPFAGTITERDVDRGALLSAGNTTTPLFKISSMDPVRIFVQVPQDVAPSVQRGAAVKVVAREFPTRDFEGKITRSAGQLDPTLRTLNTEVRVPNTDGALLPGMYVQAQLTLAAPHHVLEVPATALYSDAKGTRVAVVDADGKIKMTPIVIERDTGATIQVSSGLAEDARVVKIGAASLVDGEAVEVMAQPAPAAPAASSTTTSTSAK